jgi:transposase
MRRVVGLDIAVTAENRACVVDEEGKVLAERRFRLVRRELEALHAEATRGLGAGGELLVVMEPTAAAWQVVAALFASKGARVHVVPPEQSSDLRRYYTKHVKNDRLDAKLLARLPLLHPDGLHQANLPAGAWGALKRLVRRRSRLIEELATHRQRIRSLLHETMPGMSEVLGDELGKGAMALLSRAGDPRRMLRLGRSRVAALLIKATRGAWREPKAAQILAAARAAIELWEGLEGCDFAEVAEDLAAEVRLIRALEAEISDCDARAAGFLAEVDPEGLHRSLPGFAERTATTVAGRLGDARRFGSIGAVRSYIGMIPGTDQSGESERRPRLTKAGDRLLRTSLFLAADAARQIDPQLARIYHRQVMDKGNHHTKAVCAVATALATRLAVVLREGRPYVVRDVEGTPVDRVTARRIIAENYTVPPEVRAARRQPRSAKRMKGRPAGSIRSKAFPPSPPVDEASGRDATAAAVRG